ncbi:MAG: hypothetical protein EP341_10450 [Sphingomonadales bacterium]|nr:MAG: hypothetical protein EP341_10450 [Sphingomonadales bacterium]
MFGKPDALDRLVQVILALAALFALANGLFMLTDPFGWYEAIGTVKATGPANAHFIKDIGIAYLVSGALIGFAAINPVLRWGSALVGVLWLGAHGVLHIYEVLAGICSPDIFWRDAPGVLGPPLLVLIVIAIQVGRQRISPVPLPKSVFIGAAKSVAAESSAYLEDISNAGGFATESFQHFMAFSGHRYQAPAHVALMVALGSTRAEDCGPCVEIVRGFALAAGIDASRVENALRGKPDSEADALAYAFGAAVSEGEIGKSAELGDQLEAQYGRATRTELSLLAASSRVFPAIKRGLGHASACMIPRAA